MKLKCLHIALFLACIELVSAQGFEVLDVSFNSSESDYSPAVYDEGIVFCSNRKTSPVMFYRDLTGKFPTNLFYVNTKEKNAKPTLFAESINSNMNEGPVCFNAEGTEMYYSANMRTAEFGAKEIKLGIFVSTYSTSGWSKGEPFEWNSEDFSFQTAHPSLSPDGQMLFFSSDREGSIGGSDIYVCTRTSSGWSEPVNLGSKVNSAGSELFPCFTPSGNLYFSSNGRNEGRTDLDIYFTYLGDMGWETPTSLKDPINTSFDDFGCTLKPDGESGYFSSNRNGNDDLFEFRVKYPDFDGCEESILPAFCYFIEETEIMEVDTLPLIYEWDYGDGTTERGLSNRHCFPDFGTYNVALNIWDTLTEVHYAQVSQLQVSIEKAMYPLINSVDTIKVGETFSFDANDTDIPDFNIDNFYWKFNDQAQYKGIEGNHEFNETGTFRVQVGALSKPVNGRYMRTCSYKDIVVVDDALLAKMREESKQLSNEEAEIIAATASEIVTDEVPQDSTIYFVQIAESEKQIQLNDPYFEKINYEITERQTDDDKPFKYSVGTGGGLMELYQLHVEMLDSGFNDAIVRNTHLEKYDRQTISKGVFFTEAERAEMNRSISKFTNIQFETNSHKMDNESHSNLDYISSIMLLEQDIILHVSAHTDDVGSNEFNLELSFKRARSVVDYLVARGIDRSRIVAVGFGNAKPIASNDTEHGRALNRRVEFDIMFVKQMDRK